MIRRTLLLASMIVLLWAVPASAQSYGQILGGGGTQGSSTRVVSSTTGTGTATPASGTGAQGNLPQTGQNDIVPMVQAAIVLIGGGTLLVLVARRRTAGRRRTATA